MNIFLRDPKDKQPSVTLTMLVISFLALLSASTLHLSKFTDHTSSLSELFYACCSLYFGRRLNFAGKTFDNASNDLQQIKQPEVKS